MKLSRASLTLSLLLGTAHAQSLPAPIPAPIPPGTTWYWQLSGRVIASHGAAKLYDIDLEGNSPAQIKRLQDTGHTVVCYFSAGSYELWRRDASRFPRSAIGKKLSGWSEYYFDIRNPTVRHIMQVRMDEARRKGCDGVEPDVLDAFTNTSGFPITRQDEIDYILFLANEGHKRGLLVALKNDPSLVPDVVKLMDFAIVEECFAHDECSSYSPFVQQNKAVLAAEYSGFSAIKCARAKQLGLSLAFYTLELDGSKYNPCP